MKSENNRLGRILIVFGTNEGQTFKIAKRMSCELRSEAWDVALFDSRDRVTFDLEDYDAVIGGASVHMSGFQRDFISFVETNSFELSMLPSAFFSVCLGIRQVDDPEVQKSERHIVSSFFAANDWYPDVWTIFAGALPYSRYGWFKKQVMRVISGRAGGETDASHDYEYTDWHAVRSFTRDFINSLHENAYAHSKLTNSTREWRADLN